MISPQKRQAIYLLHEQGIGTKTISRQLSVSRKTVKAIIKQKGETPLGVRQDKIEVDETLLRRLYAECDGFVQRIYEKLTGEEGVPIGYSTLTRLLREKGIGCEKSSRCAQVPDQPGVEMQHDTSPYSVKIGEKSFKVVGSILYLRYSKLRYLKFYRFFNRFTMKCFLHEALTFFGYTAPVCIIDNTNLARLRGTGKDALIVPEMKQFAGRYGFEFVCHELGHPNRKAGNERSFYTVETNFFPGRSFASLSDMNEQARNWATSTFAQRPLSKVGAIPLQLFEHEKTYLKKLPPFVQPPYLAHQRSLDQYGYASFDGNYYWVPGTRRHDVTVIEYSESIRIYHQRELLAEYTMAAEGVKNQKIFPKDGQKPAREPKNRKRPTTEEEKRLRGMSEEIGAYLDFLMREKELKSRHRVIRQLHALSRKMARPLFIKSVCRALKYRITEAATVERIAALLMKEGSVDAPLVKVDYGFHERESFLEGSHGGEVDLTIYDRVLED